jgi:hypothetical protein
MQSSHLSEAVRGLERDLPRLMKTLDAPSLAFVLHGFYDKVLTKAPPTLQDELHDTLRLLMVRAGCCAGTLVPIGEQLRQLRQVPAPQ